MRDSVRLVDCLVLPPAPGFRTHLRRWKWLLASLTLQAALVAIGLLVPLLADNSAPAVRTSRAFLFRRANGKVRCTQKILRKRRVLLRQANANPIGCPFSCSRQ